MAIDRVNNLLNIQAKLDPIRVLNQVEINIKNATTYGEPVTDNVISIIYQGLTVNNDTRSFNTPAIATVRIQLLYRMWNPIEETAMMQLLTDVQDTLYDFEPVVNTVRPLQMMSESPVQVQGLEGKQTYQQMYEYQVLSH